MKRRAGLGALVLQADEMKGKPPFTLWRMMFQELMSSFLVAFFFFFVVFLINQVLLFAEDILSRGADFLSVTKLLFYSLPTILVVTVPFSVLAAALMTSSRQNADNEFLASSTLGVRPLWLYIPFLIVGLGLAIGSFYLNDWSIPRAAQGFKHVYAELIKKSAKIELAPYSIKKYGDKLLVTGPSEEGRIQNILIIDQKEGYDSGIVSANNVGIEFSEDTLSAVLSMDNVTEEKRPQNGDEGDFSITQAQSAAIRIQIQEQMSNYSATAPSEMSLAALARQIRTKEQRLVARQEDNRSQQATALDRLRLSYGSLQQPPDGPARPGNSPTGSPASLKNQPPPKPQDAASLLGTVKSLRNQKIGDTSLQIYRLEYQKKFVIPSACFFFAFLAFPLGIGSKRAGRTAGFGLALLLAAIYWALLFAGQTLGYRQSLDPALSMWMPNLIMFFAAGVLWIVRKTTKGHFL
jgi:lipopolysaccharide export system permease protein